MQYLRPSRRLRESFYWRVFVCMLFVSLAPAILIGIWSTYTIKRAGYEAILESKKQVRGHILQLEEKDLHSQARLLDIELQRIENAVRLLQLQARSALDPGKYHELPERPLQGSREGFVWTPASGKEQAGSTVFLSGANKLTPEIRRDIELSKHLEPFFGQLLMQNANVVATYLITKDNLTRISPPLNYDDLVARGKLPADMKVQDYPFYYSADPQHNPDGDVVWTDPYLDVTDRGWMVSCVAPVVIQENEFKGVIGADVTLENVQGVMRLDFPLQGAYAFLLNKRGCPVVLPPPAVNDLALEWGPDVYARPLASAVGGPMKEVIAAMLRGKSGMQSVDLGGDKKYCLYAPVGTRGWSLAYVIPEKGLFAAADAAASSRLVNIIDLFIERLFWWLLAGLFVLVGITFVTASSVTRPVMQIAAALQTVTRGNTQVRVPVSGRDELGVLARCFNTMAEELDNTIAALQKEKEKEALLNRELMAINRTLEEKVAERTAALHYANQLLHKVNQELRMHQEERRRLFANITHDLRTPLMAIRCCLEAIEDGLAAREGALERYLKVIKERTLDLQSRFDDLVLLAQVEAGENLFFQDVAVHEFLEDWLETARVEAEKAGITLKGQFNEDLPLVRMDVNKVRRVLDNLLDNALAHTAPGGRITVEAWVSGDQMVLSFADTGSGISREELPYIFERYYRGKGESGRGVGLGLPIAREIMRAHRGSIDVASEVGKGTTFFLRFPLEG